MKTSPQKTTQPWTQSDMEALQRRLAASKRMIEAFSESLTIPCLLRKVPDDGRGDVEALPLSGIVTIGSDGDPPFCFPEDGTLSRRHFRILVEADGTCYAEDLGSTNKLWINGKKVVSRRLVHGDQIHVGNMDFIFHDGKVPEEDPF